MHFFNLLALEEVARTMRQAADDADALIVVAPRHPLIDDVLEKVGRAKPLITLITDLPRITRHAYVGLDNLSAGRVAGDLMGLPRITRHAYVGLDNLSAGRVAGDLMGRLIGRGGAMSSSCQRSKTSSRLKSAWSAFAPRWPSGTSSVAFWTSLKRAETVSAQASSCGT